MITHMYIFYEALCITIILLLLTVCAYVEFISMVSKVFEPLMFGCTWSRDEPPNVHMGIKQSLICCTDMCECQRSDAGGFELTCI